MLTAQLQQLELRMRHSMHTLHPHAPPSRFDDLKQGLQLVVDAKRKVSASRQKNARLRGRMARVQRDAQRMLAMLAGSMATPASTPKQLDAPQMYIQLEADPAMRGQTLQQMRDFRIDSMVAFMDRKTRGIDVNRPFYFYDTCNVEGDAFAVAFGIIKIDNVALEDVLGPALDFVRVPRRRPPVENQQQDADDGNYPIISREDELSVTFQTPRHHRATTPLDTIQSVTALFVRQTRDKTVIVTDNVDNDQLTPYDLNTKLRVDLSGG